MDGIGSLSARMSRAAECIPHGVAQELEVVRPLETGNLVLVDVELSRCKPREICGEGEH